jgi:hypothetical protein
MKKLMLIAIALITLSATAQNQKNRTGDFKDLSPEEVATLNTKRMTLHLDLTASQQEEVKALMLEEAKQREVLQATRDKKRENNEAQKPSKEERYAMANERLDRQIEMKKKMRNILSAEQYEKWETYLSDKNKTRQKRRHGSKSDKKTTRD